MNLHSHINDYLKSKIADDTFIVREQKNKWFCCANALQETQCSLRDLMLSQIALRQHDVKALAGALKGHLGGSYVK